MQERNPCSGCGRERRMISTSVADRPGFPQDPLVRPIAIAPVRARHVIGECGRPVWAQAAHVRRYQLAAVEDLHGLGRDARLHRFSEQVERHRVEVLVDLDVIVEVYPAALPVRILIGCRRQRQQSGPVDLFIERASGGVPTAHRSIVELFDQLTDRLVQLE